MQLLGRDSAGWRIWWSSAATALGSTICWAVCERQGVRSKFLAVGSTGGWKRRSRGECDVAGMHLLDPETGEYNRPFLTAALALIPGYGRLQGVVFRVATLASKDVRRTRPSRRDARSGVRDGQSQSGEAARAR